MTAKTENLYTILSVPQSASAEEIRRAYRILARRYHPDINPSKDASNRFATIAHAYAVLGDTEKRREYDRNAGFAANDGSSGGEGFSKGSKRYTKPRSVTPPKRTRATPPKRSILGLLGDRISRAVARRAIRTLRGKHSAREISVIEVPLTPHEAIFGTLKGVEVGEGPDLRKVTVRVPPGVRTGSVVHLRAKVTPGDELVMVVRVLPDPYLTIDNRGVIIDLPVSIREAAEGSRLSVPTLNSTVVISLPPGTQSGEFIRLRGQGGPLKSGERGDLLYRVLIKIPPRITAPGLNAKIREIDEYYEESPRQSFPERLGEQANPSK